MDGSLARGLDGLSAGPVTSLGRVRVRARAGGYGAYVDLHRAKLVKNALTGYTCKQRRYDCKSLKQ